MLVLPAWLVFTKFVYQLHDTMLRIYAFTFVGLHVRIYGVDAVLR